MSSKINIIVPVAPSEPLDVIENSIESLEKLDVPKSVEKNLYYVVDAEDIEGGSRVKNLRKDYGDRIELQVRESGRGGKAGALNDALDSMDSPEYVCVCDVDSRPSENFLTACIKDFEESEGVFMSSCPRKVINADQNFITGVVESEFTFFADMQRFLDRGQGFNHFNGPVAVIDGDFAIENGFTETVMCEDTDFTERGYLDGRTTSITFDAYVGEQAVTSLKDLYYQKVRWMAGAREGLERFLGPMFRSSNPFRVKMSWFMTMFLPFFAFLLSPVTFLYGFRFFLEGNSVRRTLEKTVGMFLYTWFISICGLVVLKKRFTGDDIQWVPAEREDM